MKKLFLIPMSVCWLYFVSITVVLILILLSILGSVFVPNNFLTNLLAFCQLLVMLVLWVSLFLSLL